MKKAEEPGVYLTGSGRLKVEKNSGLNIREMGAYPRKSVGSIV
jgi:hypothetical protein